MILVTGGTGLVGNHLLQALVLRGERVRATCRSKVAAENMAQLPLVYGPEGFDWKKIEWVEADLTDPVSLDTALQNVEKVYHCAAQISFDPRLRKQLLLVNGQGTAYLVDACLRNGIKKLCHVSSIAALGRPEHNELMDESAHWKSSKHNSVYAVSKYAAEREVWRGTEEGLEAVIVNPAVILGVGAGPSTSNSFLRKLHHLPPLSMAGSNAYVDVRDVVKAMIILMESPTQAERFVLSAGNMANQEFFGKAFAMLGKKAKPIFLHKAILIPVAASSEWLGSMLGRKPFLTRQNLEAATSATLYSGDKFARRFQHTYIPIERSLKDTLLAMQIEN